MPSPSAAEQLLDAQVAWLVRRLTGPELPALIAQDVDDLLAAGSRITVAQVVGVEDVKRIAHLLAETVPPSTAASTLVGTAADVAHAGPADRFSVADLIDRDHVASLTDEILGTVDVIEAGLARLAASPLVTTVAARFVGRIVNDVVQVNRAAAERLPGVGSLVSLGANAAGKMIGAADKQFEQLFGDTAGKGAAFAMRRLNKVVVETLKDPMTREAVLEVFDLYADQELPHLAEVAGRDDLQRIAGLLQDVVIAGAPTPPVLALIDALVDGFFGVYGDEPVSVLIEDLDLTRDHLVDQATAVVPGLLEAARESGDLEPLLRARLQPFFDSPEVAAILA
jgi:hypothetical protein